MLNNNNFLNFKANVASNILVILFFIFFNPFYAVFFSSVINIFNKKVNFTIFSFVFSFSFALIFTIRDPSVGADVVNYVEIFKNIKFAEFIEPFWKLYSKFLFYIFRGNVDIFVIFNFFILFLMTAILSRLLSKENFVIALIAILFFNLTLLGNMFQVWRHTFAMLLLFLGIYSKRTSIWIYIAPALHIVMLPFTLVLSKVNFKIILTITLIAYFMLNHIIFKSQAYGTEINIIEPDVYFLISAIMIFIFKFLKLLELNQIETRLFYFFVLFVSIPYFLDVSSYAYIIYERSIGIFYLFISIMVAKLIISNNLVSAIFIFVYFVYRMLFAFNNPDILQSLVYLNDGRPMYIFNGIFLMISDYDMTRWSEYTSLF